MFIGSIFKGLWQEFSNWDADNFQNSETLKNAVHIDDVFLARAKHEIDNGCAGSFTIDIVGKFIPRLGVAYVTFGGVEYAKYKFELLVNCDTDWRWFDWLNTTVPSNAVFGSLNAFDKEEMLIGAIKLGGELAGGKTPNWTIGKVSRNNCLLYVPWYGKELIIKQNFNLLVWD